MIKVRVEVFSFGNIDSVRRRVVISGRDVINIIDTTGSHSDFGEISRPNSSVSVFSLILGVVRRVNSIRNNSISFIPFLIVILFEVVVSRVDGEIISYNRS